MPTILITGATDGIGCALAQHYRARGDRLVLVGRRALDTLDAPLFTPNTYCRADLSHESAAQLIHNFVQQQGITHIDVLVHNAGVGYYGSLAEQPVENINDMTTVNLRAPVALTHALYPYLEGSQIVFISSVATAMPTPDYAVYTATKAALDGFAKNLRIELQGYADVTLIHPGATRTGMHQKANMPGDTSKYTPPETVAAAIQRTIDRGATHSTIGTVNRVLRAVGINFARLVDTAMKRRYA